MVLSDKNSTIQSTRGFPRINRWTGLHKATWALICVAAVGVAVGMNDVVAQDNESDFIDAFEPPDASAAAFHNEKFQEAERALFEGLSKRDGTAPRLNETRKPQLQQAVASAKLHSDQAAPKLRQVTSPNGSSPVLQQTSLAEHPERQLPNESVQLEDSARTRARSKDDSATQYTTASNRGGASKDVPGPAKLTRTQTQKPVQAQALGNNKELTDLRRELADAKSALATAELEISRLSAIIQETSRARLSLGGTGVASMKTTANQVAVTSPPKASSEAVTKVEAPTQPVSVPSADMQVATVAVDKADLRLGAGRNHSALMSLRRGSRLAVEARQGEWYRVFAPNGQRAWIHSSLVRFGDGAASLNDGSSVKVRGYDSTLR